MSKFEIGDRVVGIGWHGVNIDGEKGIVKGVSPSGISVAVEFDKTFYSILHTCDGACEHHKGWYCPSEKLKLIESDQAIHVTTKGNEIIAVLKNGKEIVKIAKAKCSPSDTFSFEFGAKLAVERLFGTDKPIVREVKRKAKVGDYIKIIKKGLHSPVLTIGDIHKVINVNGYGDIYTDKRNFFRNKEHSEYVVLENCAPPKFTMMDTLYGKSEPKTLSDYTNKELLEELLRREN